MSNNIGQNILILIVSLLFQVVLFKYMQLSYSYGIFFYLLYIISLPINTGKLSLILLSALSGFLADLILGTGGLITIVSIFVGYIRPFLIPLFYIADDWTNKGVPSSSLMGVSRYISYVFIILFISSLLFYVVENISFSGFLTIMKKAIISTLITLPFIFSAQIILIGKNSGR